MLRIYVSVLGDEESKRSSLEGWNGQPVISARIGQRVRLRYTQKLCSDGMAL